MRTIFNRGLEDRTAAERNLWFTRGWKQRLEKMRKKHRAAGIADQRFWHPKRKA